MTANTTSHSESNKAKALAGVANLNAVYDAFNWLKKQGLIEEISKKCSTTHRSDPSDPLSEESFMQYFAPLLVKLSSSPLRYLVIYTSNSFRSDRFNENDWDAMGYKYFTEYSPFIKGIYFVMIDTSDADFQRHRKYLREKQQFFYVDDFLGLDEMMAMIERGDFN